jgi:hypothetical protein
MGRIRIFLLDMCNFHNLLSWACFGIEHACTTHRGEGLCNFHCSNCSHYIAIPVYYAIANIILQPECCSL